MTTKHSHKGAPHWMIDTPDGRTSKAHCVVPGCGATAEFSNVFTKKDTRRMSPAEARVSHRQYQILIGKMRTLDNERAVRIEL